MPSAVKSRIIVLHQTKYSDSSIILHAIDSAAGRVSFLVRVSKSGRRGYADFHCLNILEAVSSSSSKSSLSYLREWEPVATLSAIRSDMFKAAIAMFISEVLYRSLRSDSSEEGLFEWLCSVISKLETAGSGEGGSIANFHLWFLASYCTRLGFEPMDNFEPKAIFSPQDLALLQLIMTSPLEQTLNIPLSAQRRQAFSRTMLRYLAFHLDSEINIRSLDVLHDLFA